MSAWIRRSAVLSVLVAALVWATAATAQTATVTRNVNLRPDSSDEKPPIRLLTPPTVVRILSPNEEDGYFNVRTAEGQEGWVWGRNIISIAGDANLATDWVEVTQAN